MPKPQPITKAYLDSRLEGLSRTVRGDIRDLVQHFGKRFDAMDKRFDGIEQHLERVDTELEAIKESLALRREFQNLVRELKAHGISLDERRIFVV